MSSGHLANESRLFSFKTMCYHIPWIIPYPQQSEATGSCFDKRNRPQKITQHWNSGNSTDCNTRKVKGHLSHLFSCCCDKYHNQKQLGEKMVNFILQLKSIIQGNQGRNSSKNHGGTPLLAGTLTLASTQLP